MINKKCTFCGMSMVDVPPDKLLYSDPPHWIGKFHCFKCNIRETGTMYSGTLPTLASNQTLEDKWKELNGIND